MGELAQELVEYLTGKKQLLESRSIRGLDEWHRVTGSTIYEKAQPGDIIRTSVLEFGPYLTGVESRLGRLFETAARGIEIRYFIAGNVFQRDDELKERISKEWLQKAMEIIADFAKKGLKFDVRINADPKRSFAFVSLNDECIAFWVSENPIMGAWITRNFNPHLIDNAIRNFDDGWEKSKSLVGLSLEDLAALGGTQKSYIHTLMERGEKIAELDDSIEVKEHNR